MRTRWVILLLTVLLALTGCGGGETEAEPDAAPSESEVEAGGETSDCEKGSVEELENGLRIETLECGSGDTAESGDAVQVHYTGTLEDGTEFDSSVGAAPLPFTVGAGDLIPGFDQGVEGMQVGGRRKITIPPDLGYGAAGAPPAIPPNATIIFEVELVEVDKAQS